ncbi:hypothetical protein HDU93_000046 [Gonapodya sp. JEL0774]|nr:hypothetical protein HDU93_000046 [Gonapodya sp. JEL0774]
MEVEPLVKSSPMETIAEPSVPGVVSMSNEVASTDAEESLDRYAPRIKEILKTADLSLVSAKKVRKQIEAEFSVDLTARKQAVDDLILQLLDEVIPPQEQPDDQTTSEKTDESATKIKKRKKREVSPQSDSSTRHHVRSKKSHLSSDRVEDDDDGTNGNPNGSEMVETDEQLARRLQLEESFSRRGRRAAAPAPTNRKRGVGKATSGEPKPPRKSAFNKVKQLSPELAAVVGSDQMSRPQVVKKLWEYIKSRDLQDPNNKRKILMGQDEALSKLFPGRRTVDSFGMNKTLSKHFWADVEETGEKVADTEDEEDVVSDGEENSEEE